MNNSNSRFNRIQKEQLEDLVAMEMLFRAMGLDPTELTEAFCNYNKVLNQMKRKLFLEVDKITSVEDVIQKLHIKVDPNA